MKPPMPSGQTPPAVLAVVRTKAPSFDALDTGGCPRQGLDRSKGRQVRADINCSPGDNARLVLTPPLHLVHRRHNAAPYLADGRGRSELPTECARQTRANVSPHAPLLDCGALAETDPRKHEKATMRSQKIRASRLGQIALRGLWWRESRRRGAARA